MPPPMNQKIICIYCGVERDVDWSSVTSEWTPIRCHACLVKRNRESSMQELRGRLPTLIAALEALKTERTELETSYDRRKEQSLAQYAGCQSISLDFRETLP